MTIKNNVYASLHFTKTEADAVYALCDDPQIGAPVKEAISVIEQALSTYSLESLAISFNGGKDCTVLIHIMRAVLYRMNKLKQEDPVQLEAIYVRCASPFPQVEEFIQHASSHYSLQLLHVTNDMRQALEEYKLLKPKIQAIVVGTRRGDPHGSKLEFFSQTDPGWPQFMRVHPIINWAYADIWAFLRHPSLNNGTGVPYCNLYDYGYTSLGSTHNTFPNPALRSEETTSLWKPAWMLEDEALERAGRETTNGTSNA